MTAPLRIAVLGAAAIAPAAVIRPARAVPGVEVHAVAARDVARARRFAQRHGIAIVADDYDALLADPDVDAVYIPLPNGLHGAWTRRAIEAGKHVLCEKPFTANAAEAAEVAAVHRTSNVVVMEAFHWRYHPLARRFLDVVRSGAIGAIHSIDAAFSFPLLDRHDIRWDPDLAGGSLLDAGCYPVHQVRHVAAALGAGEPEVIAAQASRTRRGVDRQLRGTLRFADGIQATIACGFLRPRRPVDIHLTAVGRRGSIHAFNPILPHLGGHLITQVGDRRRTEWFGATPSYTYQLRAFVDAVRQGTPFPTTPDDAVATMTTIDALLRAAGLQPACPTPEVQP